MQKRLISMGFIITICFSLLLIGCKEAEGTTPEASSSETVSEVDSEVTSEEVTENASEEVSEEVVIEEVTEDANAVKFVSYSNYNDFFEYVSGLDGTSIVEYDFSKEEKTQAIIPNGAYHTIERDAWISIISSKDVASVQANVGYIVIYEGMDEWSIDIQNSGTDLEVSFTVNYADSTSEDFTIYVTVE